MIFMTSDSPGLSRLLSTIASGAFILAASALALTTPPTSGDTTIIFLLLYFSLTSRAIVGIANRLSVGISKNPCICPACRSSVIARLAPACVMRFATSFADIGVRGPGFLSCLAYPKYGMTAVIRLAEDRLAASIIMSSSMRWSLAGYDVD